MCLSSLRLQGLLINGAVVGVYWFFKLFDQILFPKNTREENPKIYWKICLAGYLLRFGRILLPVNSFESASRHKKLSIAGFESDGQNGVTFPCKPIYIRSKHVFGLQTLKKIDLKFLKVYFFPTKSLSWLFKLYVSVYVAVV
jgi:hypothetical protein